MKNEQKKSHILDAAATVFSQKGFHQAKMDDIARVARVAKGTLYYNYSSKSKLFAATVTQGLNQIMDAIEAELESELPFADHFHRIVSTLIRLYIANSEVTRIYANEMSSGIDDDVLAEIKAVRHKFHTFIEARLLDGQEKGYIRPLPSHLSALAVVGIIDTLCSHHLENDGGDSIDAVIDTVYTILSRGLTQSPTH